MAKQTITELFDGTVQVVQGNPFENARTEVRVHNREVLNLTGSIALHLVEHFGVIAAQFAGEDASGRQALSMQSADELTDRAISIAEALVSKLRSRGHAAMLPPINFGPIED